MSLQPGSQLPLAGCPRHASALDALPAPALMLALLLAAAPLHAAELKLRLLETTDLRAAGRAMRETLGLANSPANHDL